MIVNFFSPAELSPNQESTLTQVFSAGASYGASATGAGSGVGVAVVIGASSVLNWCCQAIAKWLDRSEATNLSLWEGSSFKARQYYAIFCYI